MSREQDDQGLGTQAKLLALQNAFNDLMLRLVDIQLTRDHAIDTHPEVIRRVLESVQEADLVELVADVLGVPPDLTSHVPYKMLPNVYCRDFLLDRDDKTAAEMLEIIERAARDGDTVTSPEARAYIEQAEQEQQQ